jgi:hypothetical protein
MRLMVHVVCMAEDKKCMQNFSETAYLAYAERIFKVFFRKINISL